MVMVMVLWVTVIHKTSNDKLHPFKFHFIIVFTKLQMILSYCQLMTSFDTFKNFVGETAESDSPLVVNFVTFVIVTLEISAVLELTRLTLGK